MDAIPHEWIDKLFNCMTEFYEERWTRYFTTKHAESFYKSIWRNGLQDLTYGQIKNALIVCKRAAMNKYMVPPTVMEFFRLAKQNNQPKIQLHLQKKHLDPNIPDHLRISVNLEIYSRLGSLDILI